MMSVDTQSLIQSLFRVRDSSGSLAKQPLCEAMTSRADSGRHCWDYAEQAAVSQLQTDSLTSFFVYENATTSVNAGGSIFINKKWGHAQIKKKNPNTQRY